ncbi:hypothetical protein [Pseudomonas brassicacearum]|uniref:hypothetical protein n=1 Tax=Pseudomonas brassicacearum TaxID=930166 RepID=UPI0012BC4090|nr:hypothetical protein [Pseudomonas brassicacearum]
MAATAEYACLRCKQPFIARTADRKRGWARYCSKSCKAVLQEARTGQNSAYHQRQSDGDGVPQSRRGDKEWDDHNDIMDGISDWDYGASDGGLN